MRLGAMLGLTGLAAVLLIGAAAAAGDTNDELANSKALFEQRCSGCHNIGRSLSKNKTTEEWRATIERMRKALKVHKMKTTIPDEEAARIAEYLVAVRGPK